MATEHLTRAELGRALGLEAGDVPLPVTALILGRNTQRNSKPLALCMLMIRTASRFSSARTLSPSAQ